MGRLLVQYDSEHAWKGAGKYDYFLYSTILPEIVGDTRSKLNSGARSFNSTRGELAGNFVPCVREESVAAFLRHIRKDMGHL